MSRNSKLEKKLRKAKKCSGREDTSSGHKAPKRAAAAADWQQLIISIGVHQL